jgi:hypothetical protein
MPKVETSTLKGTVWRRLAAGTPIFAPRNGEPEPPVAGPAGAVSACTIRTDERGAL